MVSDSGNALIISYGPAEVHFTVEQLQQQWASKRMKVRPPLHRVEFIRSPVVAITDPYR